MKIVVMGAGGVGGYFGGLLARLGLDVSFIARGAHLEAIVKSGLKVVSDLSGEFIVHSNATDDPQTIGHAELVIYSVKMYHNVDAIPAIAPLIGPDTIILPLQNGIDTVPTACPLSPAERGREAAPPLFPPFIINII